MPISTSLVPSFFSHTVQKMGREPGRFDHVHDSILRMVLYAVWVIELSPTTFSGLTVFRRGLSRTLSCHLKWHQVVTLSPARLNALRWHEL